MGRSQETFSKKEVRSKNEKKRKDKELKRAKTEHLEEKTFITMPLLLYHGFCILSH